MLDVPTRSALPSVDVAGVVSCDDGNPLAAEERENTRIYLTEADGSTPDPQSLSADGGFLFEDVRAGRIAAE